MHPEIEKLIKYAAADGEITEKERAVIIRKAESLGEELAELEIILSGELALNKKQSLQAKSNKEGDLKKCPSCGAPVASLSLKCLECGHEYRNTDATVSIKEFFKQVKSAKPEDRAMIISNFPIPNNKEDLVEFISTSIGNSREMSMEEKNTYFQQDGITKYSWKPELQFRLNEINAWQAKSQAAIMKAKVLFSEAPVMMEHIIQYEKKFEENRTHAQKNIKRTQILLFSIVIIILILMYFGTKN